ncbi:type VI secretion system baseplate subunit TssF [Pendulispora albinea]|uniref:Type VI secretion system baseplate subunit TssF n=1 Tax=Pendulispora albinea TaxID=2741071 RepID=A0ABZ2LTM9_9BACT
MFERTFQTELDYLYQLCEELGRTYPRVAPVLGRDADPGVSRLVQSLAFGFARLRERLDDELPEVIHPVMETLCPALLRAFPSATMLELEPTLKIRTRQIVEKGRAFDSRPVEGVRCAFASTEACIMQPIALRDVVLHGAERRQILLVFELFEGARLADVDSIGLYFAGDLPGALDLRAHLLEETDKVLARAGEREVRLGGPSGRDVYRRPGFADPLGSLGPPGSLGSGASRLGGPLLLAREYFAFPNKFARLELGPLQLSGLGDAERFEIEIRLAEPIPAHVTVDPTSIRMHAVPAIQISAPTPVTVRTEPEDDRWALRALVPGDDTEIVSVEKVAVVERGTLKSKPIPSWGELIPPPLEATEDAVLFYELARRRSAVGPTLDIELTFGTALRSCPPGGDIEVTLVTTQLRRAAQLGIGDVCESTKSANAVIAYRNVIPVTRAAPAVLEGDRLWHFYRYFKLGLPSLAERNELAALLARANLPAWGRWPGAKESATDFEALLDVRWRRTHLTDLGADTSADLRAVARIGIELEVVVDESRFAGRGDLHLFGEVVEQLFAGAASEDDSIRLVLLRRDGAVLFSYDLRHGTRAP